MDANGTAFLNPDQPTRNKKNMIRDDSCADEGSYVKSVVAKFQNTKNYLLDVGTTIIDAGMGVLETGEELVAEGVSNITEAFSSSLAVGVENEDTKEDNVGNNVHIPSPFPNGSPLRLGVHIERDVQGYRIAKVFENTLAHEAKLKKADILTHLDNVELSPQTIIKVLKLFSQVGITFKLTVLRSADDGEVFTFQLEITVKADDVNQTFEIDVVVTARNFTRVIDGDDAPHYITQDQDHESQQYLNMDDDNKHLVIGSELVPFALDIYAPIWSNEGQLCVIRLAHTRMAFNCTEEILTDFNQDNITDFLLLKSLNNGSTVFIKWTGHEIRDINLFLDNMMDKIVLRRYRMSDVPASARFRVFLVSSGTSSGSSANNRVRRM